MIGLFTALFFLAAPASAHELPDGTHVQPTEDTNCPPDCTPGTPQHDAWWCSNKKVQGDCELKDKVNCKWESNQCVPK